MCCSGPGAAGAGHAHAQVCLALAEDAAAGYEQADQVAWLARSEADDANLLVAVRRSRDLGDTVTSARITWAMWLYWWLCGQLTVGRGLAERCLLDDLPAALLGRVRLAAATMSYAAGDFGVSAGHWAEAFRLGRGRATPSCSASPARDSALGALAAGDLTSAAEHFHTALPLCDEAGDAGVWMRSLVHVWRGTVSLLQADPSGAIVDIGHGLELARGRGDRLTTYVALYNLAQAAIAAGDHARGHLDEGIRLSEQTFGWRCEHC